MPNLAPGSNSQTGLQLQPLVCVTATHSQRLNRADIPSTAESGVRSAVQSQHRRSKRRETNVAHSIGRDVRCDRMYKYTGLSFHIKVKTEYHFGRMCDASQASRW